MRHYMVYLAYHSFTIEVSQNIIIKFDNPPSPVQLARIKGHTMDKTSSRFVETLFSDTLQPRKLTLIGVKLLQQNPFPGPRT
ncbi:hypothetical protein HanHA89_Chr12g0469621 [Helianthus annuus]|nr:hypothetical protein HanHA89_Chr12g0469621 [Helianthus annuus]